MKLDFSEEEKGRPTAFLSHEARQRPVRCGVARGTVLAGEYLGHCHLSGYGAALREKNGRKLSHELKC